MEVNDITMYHFHKHGIHDESWHEGSEISVDDNFDADLINITKDFNTNLDGISYEKILRSVIDKEKSKGFVSALLSGTRKREDYIKLLEIAREIIWDMNIFKREMALEEIRKKYFNNLPSRKHCVWVCDKKGLDFWSKSLKPTQNSPYRLSLFEVSLTGTLFKSSESLLPLDEYNYEECLNASFNYWNPDFSNVTDDSVEYLFQGKLKVLNKVNVK